MKLAWTPHTARRLAVLYALILIAVSSLPGFKLPNLTKGNLDKALHAAEYAILGYLVARGWGPFRGGLRMAAREWLPFVILLLFAAADEYHQAWIPGRFAEWSDWLADVSGILIGYALGAWGNRCVSRHHTRTVP